MAVAGEGPFPLNDVLKEFITLFEQCCDNKYYIPDCVPVPVLIRKIASSVQIQCFAGTSDDLEDIVKRMLGVSQVTNTQMLSKNDFIMRTTEYVNSLHKELTNNSLPETDASFENQSFYCSGFDDSNRLCNSSYRISDKSMVEDDFYIKKDLMKISHVNKERRTSGTQYDLSFKTNNKCTQVDVTGYNDSQCSSFVGIKTNNSTKCSFINKLSPIDLKYVDDLIEEKKKFEILYNNLQEQIKNMEEQNMSLLFEKNAVQLSLTDAEKRESDWEHTVVQLQKDLKRSEEYSGSLVKKLSVEQDALKREKEKSLEQQQQLCVYKEQCTSLSHQLTTVKQENQLLRQSIEDLEKQLELLKLQYNSSLNSLQSWQNQMLSTQDQLDNIVKEKLQKELELEENTLQLNKITLLCKDLEAECNALKDKKNGAVDDHLMFTRVNGISAESNMNFKNAVYTSTPLTIPIKNVSVLSNESFEYDNFRETPVRGLPLEMIHKSLKDEMEAEGEYNCDRIGCLSFNSSARSEVSTETLQTIKKQNVVISQIVDEISKQCRSDIYCKNSNACGDNVGGTDESNEILQCNVKKYKNNDDVLSMSDSESSEIYEDKEIASTFPTFFGAALICEESSECNSGASSMSLVLSDENENDNYDCKNSDDNSCSNDDEYSDDLAFITASAGEISLLTSLSPDRSSFKRRVLLPINDDVTNNNHVVSNDDENWFLNTSNLQNGKTAASLLNTKTKDDFENRKVEEISCF
ncbi:uncharacterized protein LOC142320103 isoform X2 [Lycorma delicatula]|uniref:uncharacterized protein LOC142320103 isoform X2 n=1 Tax=Lycorma delicatula TaxID=130591 RepID=UPI003F5130FF